MSLLTLFQLDLGSAVVAPSTSAITTSGTVSATVFNTEKLTASAFRRARVPTYKITREHTFIARQQLYLKLSELAAEGVPLWAIDTQILPIYQGSAQVPCPAGTVDVMNLNLRTLQILGGTSSSDSGGTAANAFDQDVSTACTQTAPNGSIELLFTSPTNVTNFGLLPNTSGTWNYAVQASLDGVTWTSVYTASAQSVVAGQWQWFDIDSITNTTIANLLSNALAMRVLASGGTTLDVIEVVFANTPQEVPMGPINRDIYRNTNNRVFQGRPTQFYFDKRFATPILSIWPAPDSPSTFRQLMLTRHRQIQDVGTAAQIVEIPQRWYNAIIDSTAWMVARECDIVDPEMIPQLETWAQQSLAKAWASENDNSATYISPDISYYTA
jgi:hypothetical protein